MKLGENVSFIFDWPSLADVRKQKRFNAFRREGNTVFHSCLDRAFRKCFLCVRLFSKGKMFPILDSSMLFFSSAVKKLESDQFSWKYGTLKTFRSKKWEGSRNWRVIVSICHHLVFGFPFPLHAHPAHMTSDYFTEKARTFYLVRIVKMFRIICKICNLLTGKIENFSGRYLNTCRIIHVKKKKSSSALQNSCASSCNEERASLPWRNGRRTLYRCTIYQFSISNQSNICHASC